LLDTGDQTAWEFDDHTYRKNSTERLPGLNSVVNFAKEAGAVRVHQRRVVPTKNWSRNSATDRAAAVYDAIIERGAIGSRDNPYELMQVIGEVLDPGTVHWLAPMLAPEAEVDFDEIVELAEPVLREELEPYWPQWSDRIASFTRTGISDIFVTLEAAGVVEWTDRGETRLGSSTYPSGGTMRLTALGRQVVPHHLPEAGYVLRRLDDAPASELIDALDWVPGEQRQTLVDAWQPGLEVAERVRLIVDAIGAADDAALRLVHARATAKCHRFAACLRTNTGARDKRASRGSHAAGRRIPQHARAWPPRRLHHRRRGSPRRSLRAVRRSGRYCAAARESGRAGR
jgi:hypothetical protein